MDLGKVLRPGVLGCAALALSALSLAACSGTGSSPAAVPPVAPDTAITTPAADATATASPSRTVMATATSNPTTVSAMTSYWDGAWLFNTNLSSTYSLLNSVASSNTRINLRIWNSDKALQSIIPRSHTYKQASSLSGLTSLAQENPGPPTVIYDIEHWSATPTSEQSDPVGSIAQGASIVHSHGKLYGTAPDGRFIGIKGNCTYNISNGIVPSVNWANVDEFNVQAQQLADDNDCGSGNVTKLVDYMQQLVSIVRGQNPNIIITVQFSFRNSTPSTEVQAIAALENMGVNGIYISYQKSNCSRCTLSNLTYVMDHIGP